jgi:hypothetical protein
MKTTIISSLLIISSLMIKAQEVQNREVKPFKKIEVSGSATVVYTQSDTVIVKVEADKDEINNVYTTFEGDILIIKAKGSFNHPYKVYVFGNTLSHLTISGASKFTTPGSINADSLAMVVSGASDVNVKTKSSLVDVTLSGASVITLEGNTQALHSNVSGASSLKAYKLNAITSDVKVSGASTAKIFAAEKINANATGSSTVKFKGDPKEVSAEASGSSSVAKVVDDNSSKKTRDKNDSTTINFRKKQFVIIDKDFDVDTHLSRVDDDFHHWGGFGMGVNGWLSNGGFSLPKSQEYMDLNYGKSLNFQLNFEKDIHLYKNYINLVTGIGVEWNQYEFSNRTRLNPDSSYTHGIIDSSNVFSYKKNRLKSTFVNVPLLVEFNTNKNPDKAFHIAVGVIGGYKLGSRTRQILKNNGDEIRIIRKDNYNINPFRVNAHASIGYKNFTVFADYALTPLFENGKGPELYPFTIGVKLISF